MYYVEGVRECERVFEPHKTQGYGHFSRQPCALFASLGSAALSRIRSRCGLHGVVATFMLCLLFRFRASLLAFFLAPITIFAIWRCGNETANATTVLRTINLRKCTQLFVNRIF